MINVKEKMSCHAKAIQFNIYQMIYIRELIEFVKELMYNFKTRSMLIWRDGVPIDEVWMKVCGIMEVNHINYACKYLMLKARYKIKHTCSYMHAS